MASYVRLCFRTVHLNLFAGAALLATMACAGNIGQVPERHVLQFDRRGVLVQPTETESGEKAARVPMLRGGTDVVADSDLYAGKIIAGLESHAEENCSDEGPCRILVFIHGGLTSNRGAMRRAMRLLCDNWDKTRSEPCDFRGPLLEDGWTYPIFVNWNSGLISSYRDHLVRIQRGRDIGPAGVLGAPLKLIADTGRAAARLPIVDYEMVSHDAKTIPGWRKKTTVEKDAECYFEQLAEAYRVDPTSNSPVSRCSSDFSNWQKAHNSFAYWTSLPFKLLFAPVIDTAGTVSWDVMLRRTDLLFDQEIFCAKTKHDCRHELVAPEPLKRVRAGGLARFLDHLDAYVAASGHRWQITLIGHSMGAIIINSILGRYADLPIRNIVYMASASTIKDYKESAFPFLKENSEVEVYHLVLHPTAELRERFSGTDLRFLDLAPRGSLLLWIDNFLSKPNSMDERTAGRFANITRAMASTPLELKARVHLTVFGAGKRVGRSQPQKHGHFGNPEILEFWDEGSWFQDFSEVSSCNLVRKAVRCGG